MERFREFQSQFTYLAGKILDTPLEYKSIKVTFLNINNFNDAIDRNKLEQYLKFIISSVIIVLIKYYAA